MPRSSMDPRMESGKNRANHSRLCESGMSRPNRLNRRQISDGWPRAISMRARSGRANVSYRGDSGARGPYFPSWDEIATTAGRVERLLQAWLAPRRIAVWPAFSFTSCVSSTSTISPFSTMQKSRVRVFCM